MKRLVELADRKASGQSLCPDQVALGKLVNLLAWEAIDASDIICCTASAAGRKVMRDVSCHVSPHCHHYQDQGGATDSPPSAHVGIVLEEHFQTGFVAASTCA